MLATRLDSPPGGEGGEEGAGQATRPSGQGGRGVGKDPSQASRGGLPPLLLPEPIFGGRSSRREEEIAPGDWVSIFADPGPTLPEREVRGLGHQAAAPSF